MTDGKIEIENGIGYQHIDNGGVVYEYKGGNLGDHYKFLWVRKYNSCNSIL